MRLRLIIAYDGRPYSGWQSQRSANTIQDILEKAFQNVAGTHITVHGAGRTDAGVHALGQCAHADVFAKMNPSEWRRALNANLPPTIRVMKSSRQFAASMRASPREERSTAISFAMAPFSRRTNSDASGTCHRLCSLTF